MNIIKLSTEHRESIFTLFASNKYMGEKVEGSGFAASPQMARVYHSAFSSTYLSGLNNYHAFGAFDDLGNCLGLISAYLNPDEASWYGTNIRVKNSRLVMRNLLDHMIKFNEEGERYKFYTLWNAKHGKLLRNYCFSDSANERYDYFDEMIIPAKTRCVYQTYWQVLFNRILLPVTTVVRCTYLKQEYRTNLAIGGVI